MMFSPKGPGVIPARNRLCDSASLSIVSACREAKRRDVGKGIGPRIDGERTGELHVAADADEDRL